MKNRSFFVFLFLLCLGNLWAQSEYQEVKDVTTALLKAEKERQVLLIGNPRADSVSVIKKTAFSLGSSSITRVAKNVCERTHSPASFMLKHTILMWFKKNIDINELQKMDKILDNKTAKNIMLWLITDYCRVHTIGYKETSQLAQLGIRRQILLPSPDKETTK